LKVDIAVVDVEEGKSESVACRSEETTDKASARGLKVSYISIIYNNLSMYVYMQMHMLKRNNNLYMNTLISVTIIYLWIALTPKGDIRGYTE
jgi:hypothetical protein